MKGKFKPKFTKAEVDKFFAQKRQAVEQALMSALQIVGEEFVSNARLMGSYKDQTQNLRSSVGYVIMKDGLQFHNGGFIKIKASKKPGDKLKAVIKGPEVGEALIKTIQRKNANKYSKGFVLICVAGMHYAAYVEAKGRDVITGSSFIAEKRLKEAVERIRSKVSKAA